MYSDMRLLLNYCSRFFTEAFTGILGYVIKKEIIEEIKMNYVYEDDASSVIYCI